MGSAGSPGPTSRPSPSRHGPGADLLRPKGRLVRPLGEVDLASASAAAMWGWASSRGFDASKAEWPGLRLEEAVHHWDAQRLRGRDFSLHARRDARPIEPKRFATADELG